MTPCPPKSAVDQDLMRPGTERLAEGPTLPTERGFGLVLFENHRQCRPNSMHSAFSKQEAPVAVAHYLIHYYSCR